MIFIRTASLLPQGKAHGFSHHRMEERRGTYVKPFNVEMLNPPVVNTNASHEKQLFTFFLHWIKFPGNTTYACMVFVDGNIALIPQCVIEQTSYNQKENAEDAARNNNILHRLHALVQFRG